MNADQKFVQFLHKQAKNMGCSFIIDNFDGREPPDLIDGMEVDDVWGWLLPFGVTEKTNDHYGCFIWSLDDGALKITWRTDFG